MYFSIFIAAFVLFGSVPSVVGDCVSEIIPAGAPARPSPTSAPGRHEESTNYTKLNSNEKVYHCAPIYDITDKCSEASPLAADCNQLAYNIRNGGDWTSAGVFARTLATYGTCAMVFEPLDGDIYKVGNGDIIDFVNSSVTQCQWFDKIGSKACTVCDGLFGRSRCCFGLAHT